MSKPTNHNLQEALTPSIKQTFELAETFARKYSGVVLQATVSHPDDSYDRLLIAKSDSLRILADNDMNWLYVHKNNDNGALNASSVTVELEVGDGSEQDPHGVRPIYYDGFCLTRGGLSSSKVSTSDRIGTYKQDLVVVGENGEYRFAQGIGPVRQRRAMGVLNIMQDRLTT